MVEVQRLSFILEAKPCNKIRAIRWEAFMKSLNLLLIYLVVPYLLNLFPLVGHPCGSFGTLRFLLWLFKAIIADR